MNYLPAAGPDQRPVLPDTQRQLLLQQHVGGCVANGARVESWLPPYGAVVVWGRRPNHILHLLVTCATFGAWAPFWLLIALTQKEVRKTRHVTEVGDVIDLG